MKWTIRYYQVTHLVQLLVEVFLLPDGRLVLSVRDEEFFHFREARLVEDALDELRATLEVGSGVRRHLQLPFSDVGMDYTQYDQ